MCTQSPQTEKHVDAKNHSEHELCSSSDAQRPLKNALVNQASLPRKRERKIDYFKRYCDKNGNLNNSSNYFN